MSNLKRLINLLIELTILIIKNALSLLERTINAVLQSKFRMQFVLSIFTVTFGIISLLTPVVAATGNDNLIILNGLELIELSNKPIVIKANQPISVLINTKWYTADKNTNNHSINLPKLEGITRAQVFATRYIGSMAVQTNSYITILINRDFRSPVIDSLNIPEFASGDSFVVSFVSEKDISIYNQNILIYPHSNECNIKEISDNYLYICNITINTTKYNTLALNIYDKAGNSTLTTPITIERKPQPVLTCNSLPRYAKSRITNVSCSSTKPGKLKVQNNYYDLNDTPLTIPLIIENNDTIVQYEFEDQDGLIVRKEDISALDLVAPKLTFNRLDTTHEFIKGTWDIQIESSESAELIATIEAYTDPLDPADYSKGLYGTTTIKRNIDARTNTNLTFSNQVGICNFIGHNLVTLWVNEHDAERYKQLGTEAGYYQFRKEHPEYVAWRAPSDTYFPYEGVDCELKNTSFVKIILELKDKANNSTTYYCVGLNNDKDSNKLPNVPITCSNNIEDISLIKLRRLVVVYK
jgi:hypothetical protein